MKSALRVLIVLALGTIAVLLFTASRVDRRAGWTQYAAAHEQEIRLRRSMRRATGRRLAR